MLTDKLDIPLSQSFQVDEKTYTLSELELSLIDKRLYVEAAFSAPELPEGIAGGGGEAGIGDRGPLVGFKLITDDGAEQEFLFTGGMSGSY